MARQQRKTHQQTKQVNEDDPFVLDVSDKTHNAIASPKAGEGDFVDRDYNQSRKRDTHGVTMKHRDADQRQTEQLIGHSSARFRHFARSLPSDLFASIRVIRGCLKNVFVIWALSFLRHSTFVLRHFMDLV